MLRLLIGLSFFISVSAYGEFTEKNLAGYLKSMNTKIKKEKSKPKKIQLLTQLRNRVANTTTKDKQSKYSYLLKLQQAYSALEPDLVSKGKCEIIRADIQFRFNPEGFKKGKIEKPVGQALSTLKVFCPKLKIYQ